jgi:DNA topoisomerase VI subunit B
MTTLDEVLNSNSIVFLDGSAKSTRSFAWNSYKSKSYRTLNPLLMESEIDTLNIFFNMLNHPNTKTIPEISNEFKEYVRIISDKLSFLSSIKQRRAKKKKTYSKSHPKAYSKYHPLNEDENEEEDYSSEEDFGPNKELMKKLHEIAFFSYQKSKEKEMKINNPKYRLLTDMVKSISIELSLKMVLIFFIIVLIETQIIQTQMKD